MPEVMSFEIATHPFEKREGYAVSYLYGVWCYVEDNRNKKAWDVNGRPVQILNLGPIPSGFVTVPPATAFDRWNSATRTWVTDVAAMRDAQLAQINAQGERRTAVLHTDVPADEVASWGKQEAEARALALDAEALAPFLRALASARGIPLALLAGKVIEKADLATNLMASIIGQRQALEDTLAAIDLTAPDAAAQIAAVVWPS